MSKTFKQFVKKAITENSLQDYGGRTAGKTWSPGENPMPYKNMSGPTGFDLNYIKKDEEENHKAPNLLPYPLDTVNDHLVTAFRGADDARQQVEICLTRNPTLGIHEKELLKNTHSNLKKIINTILKISKDVEKLNLGT